MSAQAIETAVPRPATPGYAQPGPVEVDVSCRNPLLFLLTSSIIWLIISLLFGVLASVKSHAPGMMADSAALTFGRVLGASSFTFLFGFASQAGIAVALWLFARMGRTFLVLPRAGLVAGLIWNIGVLVGIIGILGGGMSHFPAFEMPARVAPIFFIAFVIFGVSAIMTFNARSEKQIYPSNWWLLAAFFVFPWIFSTAILLLGRYEIRGVMEPVVSTWFANNFVALWLAPIAIAVVYYFVSKLSAQPLQGYGLAVFGFWFYILFANAGGFEHRAGLPNWMSMLSSVANALLLLPVLVIVMNWYQTWAGHNRQKKQKDVSSKYIAFAGFAFLASALLRAIGSLPKVDEVVGLTLFVPGSAAFMLYGFISLALFGAIYHILPRLTEVDWPRPGFVKIHFILTVAGVILSAGALMLGGYVQGESINTPELTFNEVAKRVVPFLGINSLAMVVLLAGQVLLLANLFSMFWRCCAECCGRGSREVVR